MNKQARRPSGLLVPAHVALGAPRVVHCRRERHTFTLGAPRSGATRSWLASTGSAGSALSSTSAGCAKTRCCSRRWMSCAGSCLGAGARRGHATAMCCCGWRTRTVNSASVGWRMRRRHSAANPVDRTSMREPCERGGCEQGESCPPAGVNNSAQRWPASARARPAPLCRRYAAGSRPQGFSQRCDGQLAPSGAVHTTTEAHDGPLLHPRLALHQDSHVDPGLQPHAERALALRTYKLVRSPLASARPIITPRLDSTAVDLRGANTRVLSDPSLRDRLTPSSN
jgi:hypothetical protein